MNIAEQFENSNPRSVNSLASLNGRSISGPRITKQGRLFGVTYKNDDYLLIQFAEIDGGKKIISVKKSDSSDPRAVKSSTYSTGAPFINIQKLCSTWFGINQDNWKRELRLVDKSDSTDYYEVI